MDMDTGYAQAAICGPMHLSAKSTTMRDHVLVRCSFWNFDALFQPQQHPARDAHDTFFLTSKSSQSSSIVSSS